MTILYYVLGKIYFESGNVIVDRSKAMSFKNHDTFCVAPIVDKTCTEGCGYDFWAVSIFKIQIFRKSKFKFFLN